MFRCFLHESLAEENLIFIEELEKLRKEKSILKIKAGIINLLDTYGSRINLSSVAMNVSKPSDIGGIRSTPNFSLFSYPKYKKIEDTKNLGAGVSH